MKKLFFVAAFAVALVVLAAPVSAQENEYRRALAQLMERSGALASADVILDQLIPAVKQMTSGEVPAEFWDQFRERWDTKTRTRIVELYEPIYRTYLTLSDLRQIVAFYETPVGRKLAASTPAITSEGMQSGQQLGMEIAREMMEELQQLQ